MHLLLIESHELQRHGSLLASLKNCGHLVDLVHTPQAAANRVAQLWPNLIILNVSSHIADFQKVLGDINLDIPHLIVNDQNDVNATMGTNATVISTKNVSQIDQSIQIATASQKNRFFRVPGLVVDFDQRQVLRGATQRSLTPKEFKLLQLLIENRNEVMSRKVIMQRVWETDYMGDTRTLDVHIRWLREKIEDDPGHPKRLITVRGVGYRFIAPETE